MPPPQTLSLQNRWTWNRHTRIRRECRKITAEKPSSPCARCTCWWDLKEKSWKICTACLLGSGTYLECSGCSIANHQRPCELEMVLYWRKKSCQSIQPLCRYAQGGCWRGRFCLTGAWYDVSAGALKYFEISSNDLRVRSNTYSLVAHGHLPWFYVQLHAAFPQCTIVVISAQATSYWHHSNLHCSDVTMRFPRTIVIYAPSSRNQHVSKGKNSIQ